jgi:dienelactone hydrolase
VVDSSRIGFIGHSYGGRTALFAPAYDRRFKAAVCNCGSTNFKDMLKHDTGIQFDFVIPGFLVHGDPEDVVRLVEPASLLILGTDQDKWSLSIDTICEYAGSAFVEGVLEHRVYPGGHEFTEEMRDHAYRFLDDRLGG